MPLLDDVDILNLLILLQDHRVWQEFPRHTNKREGTKRGLGQTLECSHLLQ